MNIKYTLFTFASILAAFALVVTAQGATVLTTDKNSDNLNTFIDNVNTSLQNLNADKLDTASTTLSGLQTLSADVVDAFDTLSIGRTSTSTLSITGGALAIDSGFVSQASSTVSGRLQLDTLALGGNDYTALDGTGLTFSGGSLTADLGTSVDISDETNATGGTNLTISGDTFNVDDAFLVNDADDTTTGSITATDFDASDAAATSSFSGGVTVDQSARVDGNVDTTSVDAGDGTATTTVNATGVTFPDGTTQTTSGGNAPTVDTVIATTSGSTSYFSNLSSDRVFEFEVNVDDLSAGEVRLVVDGVTDSTFSTSTTDKRQGWVDVATSSVSTEYIDLYAFDTRVTSFNAGDASLAGWDTEFQSDGTRGFTIDRGNTNIDQSDLTTAWDISTAQSPTSQDVSGNSGTPLGLSFNDDGTKMYIADDGGDEIDEYDLSTAWDVTSATYVQSTSTSAQETDLRGLHIGKNDEKMYVTGQSGTGEVHEYTMSTPGDVSTASFENSFDLNESTAIRECILRSNGIEMFCADSSDNQIDKYDLSAAWDVSSASLSTSDGLSNTTSVDGIALKPDGTKTFISDGESETDDYDVGEAFSGTTTIMMTFN